MKAYNTTKADPVVAGSLKDELKSIQWVKVRRFLNNLAQILLPSYFLLLPFNATYLIQLNFGIVCTTSQKITPS